MGDLCDFFERKCPEWAKQGRCKGEEAEQMKHDCRLSCGHCHSTSLVVGANNAHEKAKDSANHLLPHPVEHGKNENPASNEAAQVPLPPRTAQGAKADTLDVLVARQEVVAD